MSIFVLCPCGEEAAGAGLSGGKVSPFRRKAGKPCIQFCKYKNKVQRTCGEVWNSLSAQVRYNY